MTLGLADPRGCASLTDQCDLAGELFGTNDSSDSAAGWQPRSTASTIY